MSRKLLGLVSFVVMMVSFVATMWAVRTLTGADSRPRSIPGLERSTAQIPSSDAPLPSVTAPAPSGPTSRPPGAHEVPPPDDSVAALAVAAELAEEAARARLTAPVESAEESFGVQVDLYLDALRRSLEERGDAAMLAYRSVWAEHFLRIDAVQEELASLSPGARESALALIRQRMGFDEDEIERLGEIDALHEERWAVGRAYMEERHRLEATFDGEALEEELRLLRERTFAHEAPTIEREEAGGFYRFERPRIYGRN